MSMLMNLAILHQLYSLCPTAPDECIYHCCHEKFLSSSILVLFLQNPKLQVVHWLELAWSLAESSSGADGLREYGHQFSQDTYI